MKTIVIVLVAFTLSGCSTFSKGFEFFDEALEKGKEVKEDTLNAAAATVDAYCESIPGGVNEYLENEINARTEKGDIHLCVP